MRAEHAAVHVCLVDDDVAEVREDVAPAVVIRQQPMWTMSGFVRITFARLRICRPLLGRGVAVVDRRPETGHAVAGQRAELVLGERLRRVEVERAALRLARQRVEHRQVEGERLAGRGAGRHEHVLAAPRGVPRLALVRVEPRHADRLADARIEVRGQVGEARLARRLDGEVRELLAGEQALPAQDVDGHASSLPVAAAVVASPYRGALIGAEITPVEPDPARTGEGSGCHERSERVDDRRLGQRRRRRHPGRPEGVRRGRACTG